MITLADPLPDDLERLIGSSASCSRRSPADPPQRETPAPARTAPPPARRPKSERIDPAQLLLFAHEILRGPGRRPHPNRPRTGPDPTPTPSPAQKKGHGRKPLPASLPRKPVVHDVPPESGLPRLRRRADLHRRGSPRATRIHPRVPGRAPAHPPQICLPGCPANVVIAERLPEPIEKGLPGPGLLAHVAVSKYADHLPLYRQEGIFGGSA